MAPAFFEVVLVIMPRFVPVKNLHFGSFGSLLLYIIRRLFIELLVRV
jgi:hypothetical protein